MPELGSEIKPFTKGAGRWIALYVDIFSHPDVGPAKDKPWPPMIAWLWMVAEATHRPYDYDVGGRVVHLKRGQLVLSPRYLARKLNWTHKAARSFLAKLLRLRMIETEVTRATGQLALEFGESKRGTLRGTPLTIVTICNYNKYQHPPTPKGHTQGHTRGTPGAHYPTSTPNKITQESNQSPRSPITTQDQSASVVPTGIDGTNVVQLHPTPPVELPRYTMTESTRRAIEALDVDPEEMLDRLHEQIDKYRQTGKGKRIDSKSRYLITCAINEAHEKTGTPKEVLKEIISGNRFAKQAAMVEVAVGKPKKAFDPRMNAQSSNRGALAKALKPR
jgi:hypothetical protein